MYEPLRDLVARSCCCPASRRSLPEHASLGLETNRRFVEAYMVGLNHEMGRELLWRGYPTDQRGTYFDAFWDPRRRPPRADVLAASPAGPRAARATRQRQRRRERS